MDPRSDASFAKYQGHELRLPTEWFDEKNKTVTSADAGGTGVGAQAGEAAERRGHARVSTSHAEIHEFRALPSSRYAVYQLCDVVLPGVQAVLSSLASDPAAPGRCLEQLGFLSRASHRRIQTCVKRACEALYHGRDPVAADAAALLEVEEEVRLVKRDCDETRCTVSGQRPLVPAVYVLFDFFPRTNKSPKKTKSPTVLNFFILFLPCSPTPLFLFLFLPRRDCTGDGGGGCGPSKRWKRGGQEW